MNKQKIGVIFGGMSTEHDVSCISGQFVIDNLDKEKYEVYPIFISKNGEWYKDKEEKEKIENIIGYLKNMDVLFPVLHGLYGEDGTIQGLFELIKVPYVGCKVLASSVGMDKVYTKIIFDKAKINQAKYVYVRKYEEKYIYVDEELNEKILDIDQVSEIVDSKIDYPMFIKPSNSGSSVGINKAKNREELKQAIKEATKYDKKILIEEGIDGREIECAVLGNEDVIASCLGEIKAADEFYSYDAKYNNEESITIIPAEMSKEKTEEIQNLAKKVFKAVDGKGLSRVDFFVQNGTEKVYINEINTLPGFTSISMYPKLFEAVGIKSKELLDRLINLAISEK